MNNKASFLLTIALLAFICTKVQAQGMEIKDYFLANEAGNDDVLNWFLVGYKGFTYTGDFGKNKDGCNIKRWTKDYSVIESNDCYSSKDGKNEHIFFIVAYLPKLELLLLEKSLVKYSFKMYSRETLASGVTLTTWVPDNANRISFIAVEEQNGTATVTFTP
ncbi:hypothetical protein ACFQ48_10815 [Hymenobacter caeli]|uniref:Lipocalin-like domain-containing protein n=1 Tax=Hymenobacter caeli TaxID=2735894 RepID=A0ABX2FSG2_9BACT|nr:hypothetical protein [Hymenobacter caeli]NRT19946.1 hypothetical protein [Hymenobacter caeli]